MNKLIECITSPPILAYPDYDAPFIVHLHVGKLEFLALHEMVNYRTIS